MSSIVPTSNADSNIVAVFEIIRDICMEEIKRLADEYPTLTCLAIAPVTCDAPKDTVRHYHLLLLMEAIITYVLGTPALGKEYTKAITEYANIGLKGKS